MPSRRGAFSLLAGGIMVLAGYGGSAAAQPLLLQPTFPGTGASCAVHEVGRAVTDVPQALVGTWTNGSGDTLMTWQFAADGSYSRQGGISVGNAGAVTQEIGKFSVQGDTIHLVPQITRENDSNGDVHTGQRAPYDVTASLSSDSSGNSVLSIDENGITNDFTRTG